MHISKRIEAFEASSIRRLRPYSDAAKQQGKKVYHLNIGQPDIKTPQTMIDAVHSIDLEVLAYGPSDGLPEYRQALPTYYARHGIDLSPEEIMVTTGGSEAILFTFLSICDPGDQIVIPEPYYTNFGGFARMAGVELIPVTALVEDDFRLPSIDLFAEKITERTKAVMICNPGNPTGHVYTKQDLHGLAELVKEKDLFLVADEVYREFVYDGLTHTSVLTIPGIAERTIMVDSISKRYSACGARIGFLVSRNKDIMASALKLGQSRLCPPHIEQVAAMAAIDTPESYNREVLIEYERRRDVVSQALEDIPGVLHSHPHGAFYIIARLPVDDAEEFSKYLLQDFDIEGETVMFAPAAGFYSTPGLGKREIRIAYVLNEQDLRASMRILKEGLAAYPGTLSG
ncbi:MAG: pyridoxal phosphate-dependent aminotransferase [Spirochaetota bacterium]